MRKSLRFEETTLDGIDLDDYLEFMGEEGDGPVAIDVADPFLTIQDPRDGCWRQAYCARTDMAEDLHLEEEAQAKE